jgi:hypothetical protein
MLSDRMDRMVGCARGDGKEFGDRMPAPITQPQPLIFFVAVMVSKKKHFGAFFEALKSLMLQ